jgi:3-methyl-2-oxobutanoate hydroxymethyltransferase
VNFLIQTGIKGNFMSSKRLNEVLARHEKIAMLTCYDATFAKLMEQAGVDVLLVGDSLGMVLKGEENTLGVSIEDMVYHTQSVKAGTKQITIIADMPFGTYEKDRDQALLHAQKLIQAGADMVKIEGAGPIVNIAKHLVDSGIPVCAHLGFTPQSVEALGGYRIQGRTIDAAKAMIDDAILMKQAGVSLMVLEMIPAPLAKEIRERAQIPTIGIGAGSFCDGQVLVLQDLLGIYTGVASKDPASFKSPRFAKNFLQTHGSIQAAVAAYVQEVKSGAFPTNEHSYPS